MNDKEKDEALAEYYIPTGNGLKLIAGKDKKEKEKPTNKSKRNRIK